MHIFVLMANNFQDNLDELVKLHSAVARDDRGDSGGDNVTC